MAHRRVGVASSAATAVLALAATACGGTAASPLPCRTPQLRVAATGYGEAGGQFTQTFTFTNASHRTCSLRGWPRLSLQTRTGRAVPVSSRRVRQGAPGTPAFRTVVLRPLAAASFNVYGGDWNRVANRRCPQTRAVLITPPGAGSALSVAVRLSNCASSTSPRLSPVKAIVGHGR